MIANERAAIGGPGLTVRTASSATPVHPVTAFVCGGDVTTGVETGLPFPLPPQAASAPPNAAPVPSFKKARRCIIVSQTIVPGPVSIGDRIGCLRELSELSLAAELSPPQHTVLLLEN
jgi:hypothetical protein